MLCAKVVLVAAGVTKLAKLVDRKVLADPWMPFVASLHMAVLSLACFFQVLLTALFTKLAETKLEVFAYKSITRDQSHIRGGVRLLNRLDWFHFTFFGFLLNYENWSRTIRKMLPQPNQRVLMI